MRLHCALLSLPSSLSFFIENHVIYGISFFLLLFVENILKSPWLIFDFTILVLLQVMSKNVKGLHLCNIVINFLVRTLLCTNLEYGIFFAHENPALKIRILQQKTRFLWVLIVLGIYNCCHMFRADRFLFMYIVQGW